MNSKHKGAHSELIASAYFLSDGAEVFRNVSQHGPADLVVWYPETNETIFVDVKTARPFVKTDGSVSYNFDKTAIKEGICVLVVNDREVVGFFGGASRASPLSSQI